ncbi:glycosyltransferase [Chloroflexota bacterium]
MKIAILHDALCVTGGAEKLVLWMKKAFPQAPIFTSVYLPGSTFPEYRKLDIRTLPFSKLVKTDTQMKLLYPLWYLGYKLLDLSEFDVVLSSSTYLAKFISPPSHVRHLSYINAPFRLLWKPESYTQNNRSNLRFLAGMMKPLIPTIRKLDRAQTRKITKIAANSRNMAKALKDAYQMQATVIYPPVDLKEFSLSNEKGKYYLSVSRLVSHKRVDIAVEACTKLARDLVVVGEGPEMVDLKKKAGQTIRFVGKVHNDELSSFYENALALLFCSEEDFGIVPLEAQASGVPVIAFGKGGALETVKDGETGLFFPEQTTDAMLDAINKFESMSFNKKSIRKWMENFSGDKFIAGIREFVHTA